MENVGPVRQMYRLLLLPCSPYPEKASKSGKSHVVDMANALAEFLKETFKALTAYHTQLPLDERTAANKLPF
jgi:hypothetical protein